MERCNVYKQCSQQPNVDIDILFFDGEDWGEKEHRSNQVPTPTHVKSWWALGSQYWSKNNGGYHAYYGILLDMVGAKGSEFHMEGHSKNYGQESSRKSGKLQVRLDIVIISNLDIKEPLMMIIYMSIKTLPSQ